MDDKKQDSLDEKIEKALAYPAPLEERVETIEKRKAALDAAVQKSKLDEETGRAGEPEA